MAVGGGSSRFSRKRARRDVGSAVVKLLELGAASTGLEGAKAEDRATFTIHIDSL